jgi:uncharacterized membrane protein YfcA
MDPALIAFGLGVGLLVGATGVGGGSIMTPLLILSFGVSPTVAVGTDIAYGALTKTVGGWRHLRMGTVDLRLCAWLAAGSVPGALLGVWILESLGDEEQLTALLVPIAVAVLLTGAISLVRAMAPIAPRARQSMRELPRTKATAVVLGLVAGVVIGMTSVGSGAVIAILLVLVFGLAPRRVVGTDIAHAAVLLWAAAIVHLAVGNVDLELAGTILLGSIPGVWVGSRLGLKLPERGLQVALGSVLLGAGLALLSEGGVELPGAIILGVPALCAAALGLYLTRHARPASKVS